MTFSRITQGVWDSTELHSVECQNGDIMKCSFQENDIQQNDILWYNFKKIDIKQNDVHQNDVRQNDIKQIDTQHNRLKTDMLCRI